MHVIAALLAALPLLWTASDAIAQSNYPNKTIRIVVGFAPAGPADLIARVIGDKLTEAWGQSVVIENVTGAGANIAGDRVAKAAPDGYTLLLASLAQLTINPSLRQDAVRHREGCHSDHASGVHAQHPCPQQRRAREERHRTRRVGACAAGSVDVRLRRRRHLATPRRRAVQVHGSRRYPPRALSRGGTRHHRSARGPYQHVFRQYHGGVAAGAGRQTARAGGHFTQARGGNARSPDAR